MRITIPCVLLLTFVILQVPWVVNASPQDPDSLWLEIDVELETPNRGSLSLIIRTGDMEGEMKSSNLTYPTGTGYYDNDNLIRILEVLYPFFSSNISFFESFLSSRGEPILENLNFGIHRGEDVFALSFMADFDYGGGGLSREYKILDFVGEIDYPEVDSDDPVSVRRRDDFVDELALCRIEMTIKPERGSSLDLQFEEAGHRRTTVEEYVRISSDLDEVHEKGNAFTVSGFILLSPGFLFPALAILTIVEIAVIGLFWYRRKYRGAGLILPSAAIISIPLHLIFYFNPHVNIYGTHDAFLFGSIMLSAALITASWFVNPRYVKTRTKTYEEEKGPSFEMPKVIYAEKNVYIRKNDEGRGIDPYEILDVTRSMSTGEIRDHYKKQVLKFHPDRFHDAQDDMKELAERETGRLNRAFEMIMRERGEKD